MTVKRIEKEIAEGPNLCVVVVVVCRWAFVNGLKRPPQRQWQWHAGLAVGRDINGALYSLRRSIHVAEPQTSNSGDKSFRRSDLSSSHVSRDSARLSDIKLGLPTGLSNYRMGPNELGLGFGL